MIIVDFASVQVRIDNNVIVGPLDVQAHIDNIAKEG